MSNIKKEAIVLGIFLFLISLNSVYADEIGCCSNPGAGLLTCSTDRLALRDKECCPNPQSNFPNYYKSQQNPSNPADYNDCTTNFFFIGKACSAVDACALGCCCSALSGSITSGPQCQGTGLTFHKGETNCNQICPAPQCSDGIDNDNNGCADYPVDNGCTSPTGAVESGGTCAAQGATCNDPSYTPKLSSLEITPVKSQIKFLLKWQDECSETAVSYDILRCEGSACTNFNVIGVTNTNSFEDASDDLLFDTIYTYQIKAHYNLQFSIPTITKAASLGNLECKDRLSSGNFCIQSSYYDQFKDYLMANFPDTFKNFANGVKSTFGDKFNKAYSCDAFNKLMPEGTSCSSTQVCAVSSNKPSCINKINCNYANANPFGLFYTLNDCENNRYCFYDRSNTIVNSCFNCDPSMSCYDYKTEDTCARDNCNTGNCKWKALANQIGIGACVSTTQYNCQWCESKGTSSLQNIGAFNNIFDFCTKDKSDILSEGAFKCYFNNGKSKNCNNVACTDYSQEQCSDSKIMHDENNKITNPSQDDCGIKVCQSINNVCVKNADGDNQADCNNNICESDYLPPNTTLLPVVKKGKVDSLIMQIYDKTSANSPSTLKTSSDYATFLCIEPCGASGHPYDISTTSRTIIVSNLNAYDGNNGNKLLDFKEGANVLRYYSQDPAKNIGDVKKINLEAHSNSNGPKVFAINITDGTQVLDKIYTSNQNPAIDVQFFEPAIVTFARIVTKDKTKIINLQGNTELNTKVSFQVQETLANGEYTLELNARNNNNIFMDTPVSQTIIIDNNKPNVVISIDNGTVFNTSLVTIKLTFDKEVNLDSVKINSVDFKNSFSTTDNKIFTATINLPDGNKNLEFMASDFAKNKVTGSVLFVVYSHPNTINIISPKFGVSPTFTFDVVAATDNNAVCRHSLDSNFEYDFMEPFTISGGTTHTISSFSKIASGDTNMHKLYIKCKDQRGLFFNSFDLNVDSTPPQIKNAFAFPNPVIEKPSITTLTIESDEPVVCKFSSSSQQFDAMEGRFDGFDNNTFRTINRQAITLDNEGSFSYYVACRNKAGLDSQVNQISFQVNLSIPISIISHTPPYFNSTKVVLAVETNKKSQCKFSELDPTAQTGEIFGAPDYSHTRQLISSPGQHTFYIVCKDQFLQKFSDVTTVNFAVDVTPPEMLFVNDSSTFELFPQKTCLTDRLRVKFFGQDNESNVKEYFYSIIRKLDNNLILDTAQTFIGGEWFWVQNLSLDDNSEYMFRVLANNFVNLKSAPKDSDGISVDISACQSKASCGDGLINQPGELCDKGFGLVNSCTQYTNFIGGTLQCTNDCKFDTSGCIKSPDCGNNQLDPGEACDGTKFGAIDTCAKYNLSFSGGTLKCNSKCELDTSGCTEKPKCGNSHIDAGESCDSLNLGLSSNNCIDYNPSTLSGGTLSCTSNCQLDTSKCQGIQGICGDNKINIGEACDGSVFGSIKSCTDYSSSFIGGTLRCTNDCKLDTSGCTEKPKCGNGFIDKNESCDTNFLGLASNNCLDYSTDFSSGTIKCSDNCKLDTSGCTKASTCGNGRLDTGELCDGDNFGSISDLSCTAYSPSFINGTLKCSSCKLSTIDCQSNSTSSFITCKDRGDCDDGASCTDNSDCKSRFCSNGKCAQAGCSDGVKNQLESDVDCGGPCGKCSNDKACHTNGDCQSNYCSFGFCKPLESCADGKLTPGESDIDCGGHCPTKCSEDNSCTTNDDCGENLQCTSSQCKKSAESGKQACNVDGLPSSRCDGIPDEWAIKNGLDPNDPNVANEDPDKDGLTNLQEYKYHTNPNNPDTDGDKFTDKQEVDAGTNPIDPKDFPKSKTKTILFFIAGVIVLVSGIGFLTYRAIIKRRGERFETPHRKEVSRLPSQPTKQIPMSPQKRMEEAKIRQALRQKEQQKIAERKKIFESFAERKKMESGETKEAKKPSEQPKQEIKTQEKISAKKPRAKKPKEDIFIKLKEIAKESKKKKTRR